jgi:hypothetical protein
MTRELKKFYVFSDESGSWHEDHERSIYLRSWIVITKEEYKKLKQIINEISSDIDCDELKWKSLSGPQGMSHINAFSELNFRIFITISSPADINWEEKYNITSNYQREISQLGFGNLDEDIVEELQNKILKDIKYTLFLNFYERTHIENVVKRIEDSINLDEYNLEYKIDPSQSNNSDWRGVLTSITDKNLEFRNHPVKKRRVYLKVKDELSEFSEEEIDRIFNKMIRKIKENEETKMM